MRNVAKPFPERWPIAAAMLPFADVMVGGEPVQEAGLVAWQPALAEVAASGFTEVDLTDSWLRVGDLEPKALNLLQTALSETQLNAVAISAIRRSVIDPATGAENLAYSHRTIDAAAALGVPLVSVGLHRPLTPEQRKAMWFWTVDGPRDDPADWSLAVARLRELSEHAASVGIELSLEMYEDTLLGSAESAVQLVKDIDHPAVGLNPDLGNLYRMHRQIDPFQQQVELCLPYSNYWHVKSYYRLQDDTTGAVLTSPAPMDSGTMNWRRAVKTALALGFRGAFCVEHYGGDGLAVMARNRDYLRGLLAFNTSPQANLEVL